MNYSLALIVFNVLNTSLVFLFCDDINLKMTYDRTVTLTRCSALNEIVIE